MWKTKVAGFDRSEILLQSENDVVFYLKLLYEAIIRGLHLQDKLCVLVTRTVAGNECDLVIAAKNTLMPLSVAEAKKPHSAKSDNLIFGLNGVKESKTVGQNYDQLQSVKYMNGLEHVYGMISTGNAFMLTCTDNVLLRDEKEKTNIRAEAKVERNKFTTEQCDPFPIEENHCVVAGGSAPVSEELYTSQLVCIGSKSENCETMLKMMMLQVQRAWENCTMVPSNSVRRLPLQGEVFTRQISLSHPDNKHGYRQNYRKIELKEGWTTCRNNSLNGTDKTISLFRCLGSGNSGDCCLAISSDQKRSCAVKFFQQERRDPQTTFQKAAAEKDSWNSVYGTVYEAKVVPLGGDSGCLVMPFVDTAAVDRRRLLANNALELRIILDKFSKSRGTGGSFCLHMDMETSAVFPRGAMPGRPWQHSRIKYRKGTQDWIDQSVEALKKAVDENCEGSENECPMTPPKKRKRNSS